MGSIPAAMSNADAANALIWAWAPAPSVTLTASASPCSGSTLAMRSSGLQDTGGIASAVMTKRPAARRCARVWLPGSDDCDDMNGTEQVSGCGSAGTARSVAYSQVG